MKLIAVIITHKSNLYSIYINIQTIYHIMYLELLVKKKIIIKYIILRIKLDKKNCAKNNN